MSELGNLLKELRGKRSLRHVGNGTGLSYTYIDRLEKGFDPRTGKEYKPTPDTLRKLAKYYKYPYMDLMNLCGYLDEE